MKHSQISQSISADLSKSARSYYSLGIEAFFRSQKNTWSDFQVAIGNLSISVELLLKAVVAQKAIGMLYTNLPDELALYLAYPNSLPKSFNIEKYEDDLKGFHYKAIEFDKAVAYFYLFSPEGKQRYKSFLSQLSRLRNQSVHGSIPGFKKYELNRLVFLSTNLFQHVKDSNLPKYYYFNIDDKTQKFLDGYKDEQVAKVKKAVEEAQKRVKDGNVDKQYISVDDWESYIITCPICGSDTICNGETEADFDQGELYLTFNTDEFECESCGLHLEGYDELALANIDAWYDRDSESEKERWLYEHDGDPCHPYY